MREAGDGAVLAESSLSEEIEDQLQNVTDREPAAIPVNGVIQAPDFRRAAELLPPRITKLMQNAYSCLVSFRSLWKTGPIFFLKMRAKPFGSSLKGERDPLRLSGTDS